VNDRLPEAVHRQFYGLDTKKGEEGVAFKSLALRGGKNKCRIFENRERRRIFGPKREEVAGGWRRLHNEELHNLYAFTKYC
jgi:hypothetical protein